MEIDKSSDTSFESNNTLPHPLTTSCIHRRRRHIHNIMERPEQIIVKDEQVRESAIMMRHRYADRWLSPPDTTAGVQQNLQ